MVCVTNFSALDDRESKLFKGPIILSCEGEPLGHYKKNDTIIFNDKLFSCMVNHWCGQASSVWDEVGFFDSENSKYCGYIPGDSEPGFKFWKCLGETPNGLIFEVKEMAKL